MKKNYLKLVVATASSLLFCGHSFAASNMTLCNATDFDVSYSFIYDQTTEAAQYKRGDDRFRVGGWIYIDSGKCDQAIPLGNGQLIYFSFSRRGYDGGGSVILKASGIPQRKSKKLESICVDTRQSFDISSNQLAKLSRDCPSGFEAYPVSFGLRGGSGNFRISLTR